MRVLIDICHPAHAHFFRHPIRLLRERGCEVAVTSRLKEMATELLDEFGLEHVVLSTQSRKGVLGLARELVLRNWRLRAVARRFRPDVMAAIGGTFVAHVGAMLRIPALVFYDTENATLQNAITYPFAACVLVPDCYTAKTPRNRTLRYRGYHELSYLRPPRFSPDRAIALQNGLAQSKPTYLVRLVSWQANHDIGERGISTRALHRTVGQLEALGTVLISSEGALPSELEHLRYRGAPGGIHHVMAFCAGFFGESATMASECAVLGVPAVYAATTPRGYTDAQETRYGLVHNARSLDDATLEAGVAWLASRDPAACAAARARLLEDTIDVAAFVADRIVDPSGTVRLAGAA